MRNLVCRGCLTTEGNRAGFKSRQFSSRVFILIKLEHFTHNELNQFPNRGALWEPLSLPRKSFAMLVSAMWSHVMFVHSDLLQTLIAFLFNQLPCA